MVDHWSNFYAQSNDVFKLLANSTDILFGQSDKLQNFLDGPPTTPVGFLQYILKLNSTDAFEQFNFKMDRYQSLYKLAFPERKKPLPNTPHVVATDVHQINISINPAFSSKALRPGETETFPIWSQRFNAIKPSASESALSSAENIVLVLVNQGITANIVMLDEMVSVEVDIALLCKQFSCNYIQVRESTGNQYRAYIHRKGQKTLRQRLGVLIVPPDQSVLVFSPLPRETRSDDIYTQNVDQIELPFESNKIFYKKFD